jgi:hypothetical protein
MHQKAGFARPNQYVPAQLRYLAAILARIAAQAALKPGKIIRESHRQLASQG